MSASFPLISTHPRANLCGTLLMFCFAMSKSPHIRLHLPHYPLVGLVFATGTLTTSFYSSYTTLLYGLNNRQFFLIPYPCFTSLSHLHSPPRRPSSQTHNDVNSDPNYNDKTAI